MRTMTEMDEDMLEMHMNGYSVLESIGSRSDWTGAYDVSFGHFDNFGKKAHHNLLETKEIVVFGDPDLGYSLPACGSVGDAVPGALYCPAYKVGTALDMHDLEIHVLHDVLHFGHAMPRHVPAPIDFGEIPEERNKRKKLRKKQSLELKKAGTQPRGSWLGGNFYPDGIALLDWNSREDGSSRTAVEYRKRRHLRTLRRSTQDQHVN